MERHTVTYIILVSHLDSHAFYEGDVVKLAIHLKA